MKTPRFPFIAILSLTALVGCAATEEPKTTDEGSSPKPECVPLKPGVVRNFNDGTTGPGIEATSGQAVELTEKPKSKPIVNYAVALLVDTPEGEQVALLATQKLDGGGFTVTVDETARKLFVFGADISDDGPIGQMRAKVASSVAGDSARTCLK